MNILGGWSADDAPREAAAQIMASHKANGIAILVLSVLRLLWRMGHPPPPPVESLKAWEIAIARVVHALFYMLLIALPLAGWLTHSAATGGAPVSFFGLFAIPGLPLAQNRELAGLFGEVHGAGASIMVTLLALHVLAALKHQFLDRDRTLWRMLPLGRPPRPKDGGR